MKNSNTPLQSDERKRSALTKVSKKGHLLEYVDDIFKDDEDVVSLALHSNSNALQYASERLRNNKKIVLTAVSGNGSSLRFASTRLKNDEDIVFSAVQNNAYSIEYVSSKFKDNNKLILIALASSGLLLQYASTRLKDDFESVMVAVSDAGASLQYASTRLKNNKKTVLAAVKENGHAIQFTSRALQSDKKIVRAAIKSSSYILGLPLAYELSKNKDFVLDILYNDTDAFSHVHISLKMDLAIQYVLKHANFIEEQDWPIVKKALMQDTNTITNPPKELKSFIDDMKYPYLILADLVLNKCADKPIPIELNF